MVLFKQSLKIQYLTKKAFNFFYCSNKKNKFIINKQKKSHETD